MPRCSALCNDRFSAGKQSNARLLIETNPKQQRRGYSMLRTLDKTPPVRLQNLLEWTVYLLSEKGYRLSFGLKKQTIIV